MIAPQDRDDGGLGWLFQLVAVFVFFVLPVVRSIAESRKKARESQAGRAHQRAPKPAERSGRDLWRDLLEGRGEPPAAPPARRVAVPPKRSEAAAPRPPAPRPAALETAAPRPASLESVPPELVPKVEDTYLEASFTPGASELATREIDPATLDDELVGRWDVETTPAARRATSPAQAALLAGGDWRRAVLLAEVLAPPLALRGPAAAWPGPPASLRA